METIGCLSSCRYWLLLHSLDLNIQVGKVLVPIVNSYRCTLNAFGVSRTQSNVYT